MTIEEKRSVIRNYCITKDCDKCVLHFRSRGSCYSGKNATDEIVEENYRLVVAQMKDAEIKEPTIMQDRVAIPMDKGTMTVKGTCYEDVLNILCRNGYATNIHTEPCKKNLGEIEHTIVFWKESVSDNSYQE